MVNQEIKTDSSENIVDQEIKPNGVDDFALVIFAVFLFVISIIFFGVFTYNFKSSDAENVANSIIYQWASLISVLLGIGMVAFAALFRLDSISNGVK